MNNRLVIGLLVAVVVLLGILVAFKVGEKIPPPPKPTVATDHDLSKLDLDWQSMKTQIIHNEIMADRGKNTDSEQRQIQQAIDNEKETVAYGLEHGKTPKDIRDAIEKDRLDYTPLKGGYGWFQETSKTIASTAPTTNANGL